VFPRLHSGRAVESNFDFLVYQRKANSFFLGKLLLLPEKSELIFSVLIKDARASGGGNRRGGLLAGWRRVPEGLLEG
jgi:hypothetical protein